MNVRNFSIKDYPAIKEIFARQGLPTNCMPELLLQYKNKIILNPRFQINRVCEDENGKIGVAAFLKITSEPYLLLDHGVGTPEWRWVALIELMENMAAEAKRKGLEDCTCWVPPHLVDSFGPRLLSLGFMESPWASFTKKL